jgi:hypothetical protein
MTCAGGVEDWEMCAREVPGGGALGLWDRSTENATVATTPLANLVARGLDVEQGVLLAINGARR